MKIPSKPILVGGMLVAASAVCLTGCVKDNPKSQQQSSYMQSHADMYGPAPAPEGYASEESALEEHAEVVESTIEDGVEIDDGVPELDTESDN